MADKIQFRRDTSTNWTSVNPILAEGELGLETDTLAYKIGDGINAWSALGYRELSGDVVSLLMTAISEPAAPAAGKMKLYPRDIAGRIMPKFLGPSGLDTVVQPALFNNGIQIVSPGATTSFSYLGISAFSATGTVSHPAITPTNLRTSTRRGIVTSAATANSVSQLRNTVYQCYRGAAPGIGGFFFAHRFAISTNFSTQAHFAGLSNNNGAWAGGTNPSTILNSIGFGYDAGDANYQFMSNDGAGTANKIDTGMAVLDPNEIFEIIMFAPANSTSVGYRLKNLVTGAEFSGVYGGSKLPAGGVGLTPTFYLTNGSTASSVVYEFMRYYLETDQ